MSESRAKDKDEKKLQKGFKLHKSRRDKLNKSLLNQIGISLTSYFVSPKDVVLLHLQPSPRRGFWLEVRMILILVETLDDFFV